MSGLALTAAGLWYQRQQARELDARETRLRGGEGETERREASLHVSMLLVKVSCHASSLDPSATLWQLTVTNGSAQPRL
ncbi:hypothetical protein [Streptomyces sp. HUAS ZL42]|uniref:hypothetical protein n=1 Tax=Streptomyces sp. HUAS ZL42 TaxID=3231715 RepID=UPI00345E094F